MRDIEKALDELIESVALATNQCPNYLRDAYFRAGYHSRDEEPKTTKRQLEESLRLIEEMCIDDCGIDLAKEDRESLESIIMGNDEKCVKFLNKLKNEGGE